MANYIDGFVLPIPKNHLDEYQRIATRVAEIWKEHGALSYAECVSDDFSLDGVQSFPEAIQAKEDEVVVFGWVVFPSKGVRDSANLNVPKDPRMADLVAPLTQSDKLIFDASKMVYGGFKVLVQSN